jgi:hypothetical protein
MYARRRGAYNDGGTRELRFTKPDLDALVPVVSGRMPLIVGAHRAADIREVLKLARDYRLKVVLAGAEEGWMVADEIARARVPVMLTPLQTCRRASKPVVRPWRMPHASMPPA